MIMLILKTTIASSWFYSVRYVISGEAYNPIPFQGDSVQDHWDDALWSLTTSTPMWLGRTTGMSLISRPIFAGTVGPSIALLVAGEVAFGDHQESEVLFGESLYDATWTDRNRLRLQSFGSSTII